MKKFTKLVGLMAIAGILLNASICQKVEAIQSQQVQTDFTIVAKKAIPAVVWIKVKSAGKEKGITEFSEDQDSLDFFNDDFLRRFFGLPKDSLNQPVIGQASGFIVSADGYILTNSHVVNDMSEITVVLDDGKEYPGKVIGQDTNTDIALIKIDAKNLPYLVLGDSEKLEVGQWVVAIGNPLGLQASLTVGVVSAKGRNNLSLTPIENYIQTDAAINRGNSGGPLLNLNGEVIGINTAIASNMGGGYMGIGFAIPSNIAKYDMEQILETGSVSRGFLGVTLQQLDNDLTQAFGLEKAEGVIVTEVSKDSPAEKAGIKQGDVITKYNNHAVTNAGALRNAISMMKPDTKVTLSILRDKKLIEIPVILGNFPNIQQTTASSSSSKLKENKLGIEVQALSPENARSLGYSSGKGVVISKVNPGSIGAWAGLKKGNLIVSVNQKDVNSVDEFNAALQQTEKDKPILLLIKQGDYTRYVSIKVE